MSTDYDPTEFSSPADYARSRAAADVEFGMPSKPYPITEVGRRINEIHADREDAANREFGGPSRAETRRKWGLAGVADPKPPINGYDP